MKCTRVPLTPIRADLRGLVHLDGERRLKNPLNVDCVPGCSKLKSIFHLSRSELQKVSTDSGKRRMASGKESLELFRRSEASQRIKPPLIPPTTSKSHSTSKHPPIHKWSRALENFYCPTAPNFFFFFEFSFILQEQTE